MRYAERALVTSDGAALWTRTWAPDAEVRAAGVLVHGLGEHSGRYDHVGRQLAEAGYALHGFDLRGHGRSSGRRGDTRLETALDDLERIRVETESQYGGSPAFLYGHSLGALITLAYIARRRPALCGAILSAPPLITALRQQRAKVVLARALGRVLPGLRLPTGLDPTALSRDGAVVTAYRSDPLVHSLGSLGFARDALKATDAMGSVASFGVPLLLLHGTDDRIACVDGSRVLAARLGGETTLREYRGGYHEPHNDVAGDEVIRDVVEWLDRRLAGPS